MANKVKKTIIDPIKEAARLLKENPNLKHFEALKKAKEELLNV